MLVISDIAPRRARLITSLRGTSIRRAALLRTICWIPGQQRSNLSSSRRACSLRIHPELADMAKIIT